MSGEYSVEAGCFAARWRKGLVSLVGTLPRETHRRNDRGRNWSGDDNKAGNTRDFQAADKFLTGGRDRTRDGDEFRVFGPSLAEGPILKIEFIRSAVGKCSYQYPAILQPASNPLIFVASPIRQPPFAGGTPG